MAGSIGQVWHRESYELGVNQPTGVVLKSKSMIPTAEPVPMSTTAYLSVQLARLAPRHHRPMRWPWSTHQYVKESVLLFSGMTFDPVATPKYAPAAPVVTSLPSGDSADQLAPLPCELGRWKITVRTPDQSTASTHVSVAEQIDAHALPAAENGPTTIQSGP